MRKVISILLLCTIIFGAVAPAASASEENGVQSRYAYIHLLINDFSINSSTKVAHCYGKIAVRQSMSLKVVATLQVQENGVWRNINSRTATGTLDAIASYNPTVVSGYQYRLVVTGYVYDSNGNLLEMESSEKYAWCY